MLFSDNKSYSTRSEVSFPISFGHAPANPYPDKSLNSKKLKYVENAK